MQPSYRSSSSRQEDSKEFDRQTFEIDQTDTLGRPIFWNMQMPYKNFFVSFGIACFPACALAEPPLAQMPDEAIQVDATIGSAALVEIGGRHTLGGVPYTGIVFDRYPGGAKKARYSLEDGRAEGAWTEWHDSGGISFYGEWRAGLGEGAFVYFHPNGEIRERAIARADIWHGVAEGWHPNGAKAFERVYDQGKLTSEQRYSESGEAIP
jgi:hypothetical protein